MTTSTREERGALRAVLSDMFDEEAAPEKLRELWESNTGRSETLWKRLAEVGMTGLLIDEERGGSGATELEAIVLLEEVGRYCVPDPVLESVFIGTPLIAEGGSAAQQERWLPALADGSAIVTVALGGARHVVDAHIADVVLMEVDGQVHALTRADFDAVHLKTMDPSRRVFDIQARPSLQTQMPADAEVLARAVDRARVGSAAVLIGIASHLLDATVDYVRQREQFGRVVGSFQAVKHLLAESHAALVLARQATVSAAEKFAEGTSDARTACLAAKICAVGAERRANDVALQCHGGIGFTWEYDLQMWLKRGKALEMSHGSERELAPLLGASAL